jgi:hypothetical protein
VTWRCPVVRKESWLAKLGAGANESGRGGDRGGSDGGAARACPLSSLSGSSLARFQEGRQEEEKGVTAGNEREREGTQLRCLSEI